VLGRIIQSQTLMVALAILLGYASIVLPVLLFWSIMVFPSTVLLIVAVWIVSCICYAVLKIYARLRYPD